MRMSDDQEHLSSGRNQVKRVLRRQGTTRDDVDLTG